MPKYKILKHFPNVNNWSVGDIVDITDAKVLLEQEFVSLEPKEISIEEEILEEEIEEVVPNKKWKKPELVEYANSMGLKVKGTKAKIMKAIKETLKGGE